MHLLERSQTKRDRENERKIDKEKRGKKEKRRGSERERGRKGEIEKNKNREYIYIGLQRQNHKRLSFLNLYIHLQLSN